MATDAFDPDALGDPAEGDDGGLAPARRRARFRRRPASEVMPVAESADDPGGADDLLDDRARRGDVIADDSEAGTPGLDEVDDMEEVDEDRPPWPARFVRSFAILVAAGLVLGPCGAPADGRARDRVLVEGSTETIAMVYLLDGGEGTASDGLLTLELADAERPRLVLESWARLGYDTRPPVAALVFPGISADSAAMVQLEAPVIVGDALTFNYSLARVTPSSLTGFSWDRLSTVPSDFDAIRIVIDGNRTRQRGACIDMWERRFLKRLVADGACLFPRLAGETRWILGRSYTEIPCASTDDCGHWDLTVDWFSPRLCVGELTLEYGEDWDEDPPQIDVPADGDDFWSAVDHISPSNPVTMDGADGRVTYQLSADPPGDDWFGSAIGYELVADVEGDTCRLLVAP